MAFELANFGTNDPGTRAAAPTLYSYGTTVDAKAAVIANGYFNDARARLEVGDMILMRATDATEILIVNGVPTTGDVTVDPQTIKKTA